MILVVILLLIAGVFAVAAEAVLPFGISAGLGILAILVSAYLAYQEYGAGVAALYLIMALAAALILLRLVTKSGLEWLALRPPPKREGGAAPSAGADEEPPMGATATVVQVLRPTGSIQWEGHRYPARSLEPERASPPGSRVRIVGRDSIYFLVEEIPPETSESRVG